MKISTKLLTLLLAFSLFAMIGSDLTLKAKFDKIDQKDPYSGYLRESVKPFKYVKLTGNFFGYTQIVPGKAFELRMTDFQNYTVKPKIDRTVSGDTLNIHFETPGKKSPYNNSIYFGAPHLYIIAPQLSGVQSVGITSKIQGWQNGTISVQQSGHGMLFANNHFDTLLIDLKSGGYLNIEGQNLLGNTSIMLKDTSSLMIDKDIFKTFQMQVDSTARINIPGSLYRKTSKL